MPDWVEPWLAPALIVALFAWLRADIGALRTEIRADINTLRGELNGRIDALTATVNDIDRRVARLEGMLSGGGNRAQPQVAEEHSADQRLELESETEPRRRIRRRIELE